MKKETKIWLEIAEEDYKHMEYMREGTYHRGAVLFAQQAVEKILKAYITEHSATEPRKIHKLEKLVEDAQLDLSELDNPPLQELSRAYGWVRYRDLSNTKLRSQEEVEKLLVMARTVYVWVHNKLQDK
jgi:HEPN domain-containing protein